MWTKQPSRSGEESHKEARDQELCTRVCAAQVPGPRAWKTAASTEIAVMTHKTLSLGSRRHRHRLQIRSGPNNGCSRGSVPVVGRPLGGGGRVLKCGSREREIPRKSNRDWKDQDEGHLACWLAGNVNDVENAIQKKSQMRIMEEQLSRNRTGGMSPADRGLGVLSNSASTDPSRGTGESQVLGSSSWLHCLL